MTNDILTQLTAAKSDDERGEIVLQFSLESLDSGLRDAVRAAAIPHWFDVELLAALLDKSKTETLPIFEQLLSLSIVEPFQGRGYNIHERTRSLLLKLLWQNDRDYYIKLSQRVANYCYGQDKLDTGWRIETIYHLLIANPNKGVEELQTTGWEWHNPPNFAFDKVEAMVKVVQGLLIYNRLNAHGKASLLFWEGLLDSDYSRYESAKSKLLQIENNYDDPYLTTEVYLALGKVHIALSEYEDARKQYDAAILLCQQINNQLGEANGLAGLGDVHLNLSEYGAARTLYETALRLYRQFNSRLGEVNCLSRLGEIHLALNEYELARKQFDAAVPLYQKINDQLGEANCISGQGDVHLALNELDPALKRYKTALNIYQHINSQLSKANCLVGLGYAYLASTEYALAQIQFETALILYQQMNNSLGEASCIKGLGDFYLASSEYSLARKQFETALTFYQQFNNQQGEAGCLAGLGYFHLASTDYALAQKQFEAALNLYHRFNNQQGEATCLAGLGSIHFFLSHLTPALENFDRAIVLNEKDYWIVSCRAETYRRIGRIDKAAENLTVVINSGKADSDNFSRRAAIFLQLGKTDEARSDIKSALNLPPKTGTDYYGLCLASILSDKKTDAIKMLKEAFIRDPARRIYAEQDGLLSCLQSLPEFEDLMSEYSVQLALQQIKQDFEAGKSVT
jgi:tetratricopeptide (TPR) repeat protein